MRIDNNDLTIADALNILSLSIESLSDYINGLGVCLDNYDYYPVIADEQTIAFCVGKEFNYNNHIFFNDTYTLWMFLNQLDLDNEDNIPELYYDEINDIVFIDREYSTRDILHYHGFGFQSEMCKDGALTSIIYKNEYSCVDTVCASYDLSLTGLQMMYNCSHGLHIGEKIGKREKPEFNNQFNNLVEEV